MSRGMVARLVLSVVLVATVVAEIGFTWFGWTGEHIFNPQWHPHARFHAAQQMGFAIFIAVGGLWLVWRRPTQGRTLTRVVAVAVAAHWAMEFFATYVNGTSPSPIVEEPNTVDLLGMEVHGNLLYSGAMVVLCAVAFALIPADPTPSTPQSTSPTARPGRELDNHS